MTSELISDNKVQEGFVDFIQCFSKSWRSKLIVTSLRDHPQPAFSTWKSINFPFFQIPVDSDLSTDKSITQLHSWRVISSCSTLIVCSFIFICFKSIRSIHVNRPAACVYDWDFSPPLGSLIFCQHVCVCLCRSLTGGSHQLGNS